MPSAFSVNRNPRRFSFVSSDNKRKRWIASQPVSVPANLSRYSLPSNLSPYEPCGRAFVMTQGLFLDTRWESKLRNLLTRVRNCFVSLTWVRWNDTKRLSTSLSLRSAVLHYYLAVHRSDSDTGTGRQVNRRRNTQTYARIERHWQTFIETCIRTERQTDAHDYRKTGKRRNRKRFKRTRREMHADSHIGRQKIIQRRRQMDK